VNPARRGIVVATCPLSGSGWQPVRPGEMLVLRDGKLCYNRERFAAAGN
jgi:predicted glutamine amidotransferase